MIPGTIFYIAVIAVCGFASAAAILGPQRRRLVEIVAVSAAFGCGAVPILLTWISCMGFRPTRGVTVILGFAGVMAIFVLWRIRGLPGVIAPLFPKLTRMDLVALPAILLLVAQLFLSTAAASLPVFETDAMAIWGLKAKVLYHEALRPAPAYFSDLSPSYTHLEYPLLVPMLWAGAYGAIGGVDDGVGKIVLVVPLFALAALLYSQLRRAMNRSRAMLLTALAIGLPAVLRFSATGQADTILSLFLLGSAVFTLRWIAHNRIADAVAAGMFAAFAANSKLEGLVVVGSCAAVVTIAMLWQLLRKNRRRIGGGFGCVAAVVIVFGPWFLWGRGLPRTHEDYAARLTWSALTAGVDRLPIIARLFAEQMRNWTCGPTIAVFLLAALFGWRGWSHRENLAVWIILGIQAAAYLVAYMITPWELPTLISFTASRLLMQLAPLMMLLAGLHWRHVAAAPHEPP